MKVIRAINNNIVSAVDDDDTEIVVTGRGIGYKAGRGEEIPPQLIEKVFRMSTQQETDRLKELFASLPQEYIDVSDEIIAYAKKHLGRRLNESIYITLTDHISFAIDRLNQGMNFHNALFQEVRQFYSEEYAVGKYALQIIQQHIGLELPKDEAASIALHIINAEYDTTVSDAFHITRLLERVLEQIQALTGHQVEERNYYDERFLTHLKYLTRRVIKKEPLPQSDPFLYNMMAAQYPAAVQTAQQIAAFVTQESAYPFSQDEIATLAIHLEKMQKYN